MKSETSEDSGSKIQNFWELGFLVAGFAACFYWDGPIELKILLMLILIRSAFSWGELVSLEKTINENAKNLAKQQGVMQAMIYELRARIMKEKTSIDNEGDAHKIVADLESYLDRVERNFDKGFEEGFEQSKRFHDLLNPIKVDAPGFVLLTLSLEIGLTALVGWGIAYLLTALFG